MTGNASYLLDRSGEVEESVQLSHPSMTEGSIGARDGVEEWGVVLLR